MFREILLSELPAYGNSIALFLQEYESLSLNMWVMKQYGVVSSWTNALSLTMTSEIVCLTRKHIPKPVGVTKNGKVVLEIDGELCYRILKPESLRILGFLDMSIILLTLTLRVYSCLTKPPTVQLHTEE